MKLKLPQKQTIYLATNFDNLLKLLNKLYETYELTNKHLRVLRSIAENRMNVHAICWFPEEDAFKFATGYIRSIVYDSNNCDIYELRDNELSQIYIDSADFLTNQLLADGIVDTPDIIIKRGGLKQMFRSYNEKFDKKMLDNIDNLIDVSTAELINYAIRDAVEQKEISEKYKDKIVNQYEN